MSDSFEVKDSGKRKEFQSGMVRDVEDNKVDYTAVLDGPMFDRWAAHLTKAKAKYADVAPGVANWTLANGEEELVRFRKSALRHLRQWLRGDTDEDHASAVFFNINGAEYVKGKMRNERPSIHAKGCGLSGYVQSVDPVADARLGAIIIPDNCTRDPQ